VVSYFFGQQSIFLHITLNAQPFPKKYPKVLHQIFLVLSLPLQYPQSQSFFKILKAAVCSKAHELKALFSLVIFMISTLVLVIFILISQLVMRNLCFLAKAGR
jgi:hypothetical protein